MEYGSVASGTVQTSKQCGRRLWCLEEEGRGKAMVREATEIVPTARISRIYGTRGERGVSYFIPSGEKSSLFTRLRSVPDIV